MSKTMAACVAALTVVGVVCLIGATGARADLLAAPTAQISSPAGGQTYAVGTVVPTSFSCSGASGDPVLSCVDSNGAAAIGAGSQGAGQLDTAVPGTYTYTVTATSAGGQGSAQITYTVTDGPIATITAPADGRTFGVGQTVPTSFHCTPGANAATVTCQDSNGAGAGAGALDTTAPGSYVYSVTAGDPDGQTRTSSIHYTVAAPPTVSVAAPLAGTDYPWQSLPASAFSCTPGAGATLQSCTATVDGGAPFASGAALPDAIGPHTMAVTAVDADGVTTSHTVAYTASLSMLPSVSATAPTPGARYSLDQIVRASYRCVAAAQGSGLASCTGSSPSGHPIDTSSLGRHAFVVTARDVGGQSSTAMITYLVIPTTNRFTAGRPRVGRGGAIGLTLRLPGPGAVIALATAAGSSGRGFVFARSQIHVRRGGSTPVTLTPNGRGRSLLAQPGLQPLITLRIVYTPTGGRPRARSAGRIRIG